MRLFATGAVSWVMNRALPEDVPLEAKMVTKSIERAQNTVEAKNAEIRKDVLKYDEVMDKQRKIIYERRLQIIDGENLRELTENLLTETIQKIVADAAPSNFPEEWDLPRLVAEASRYYPTKFTPEELEEATTSDQLAESLLAEAFAYYEEREEGFPGGAETARELERNIMLQIIDQRWRMHLVEMDYLRHGIGLRGMAQQDPLVAFKREGFEMFGQLMDGIDDDYLQYVMHAQLIVEDPVAGDLSQATYVAADDPMDEAAVVAFRRRGCRRRRGGSGQKLRRLRRGSRSGHRNGGGSRRGSLWWGPRRWRHSRRWRAT